MRNWYEDPYLDHYLRLLDHNLYYQDESMVGNFPSTNYVMGMVNVSIFSIFLFGSGFDMTYMLVHPNNVGY
jgi:hypothetical protein